MRPIVISLAYPYCDENISNLFSRFAKPLELNVLSIAARINPKCPDFGRALKLAASNGGGPCTAQHVILCGGYQREHTLIHFSAINPDVSSTGKRESILMSFSFP
jgi:hypothetical protein